ncbi:MAG: glycine/sarcosine/betaine reductase selenoprotein B family protein [Myxococcota bacterium]
MSESKGSAHEVDSWRFTGSTIGKVLAGAIPDEPKHAPIPWAPFDMPLSEARVSLLTTAGLSMKGDPPFDMEYERQNPTRGDSTFRALRADATEASIEANHLHIDTGYLERDINVALPLPLLHGLAEEGVVGSVAPTHYSIMGFQGADSSQLENESAPEIARRMKSEGVDLALLAPV